MQQRFIPNFLQEIRLIYLFLLYSTVYSTIIAFADFGGGGGSLNFCLSSASRKASRQSRAEGGRPVNVEECSALLRAKSSIISEFESKISNDRQLREQ